MKRKTICAVALALSIAALSLSGCSYNYGSSWDPMRIVISPESGALEQALDVAVTIQFEDMLEEPTSWLDSFALREYQGGETLCTDVVYDDIQNIATCVHDELKPGTTYYINIADIPDVADQLASFRTAN